MTATKIGSVAFFALGCEGVTVGGAIAEGGFVVGAEEAGEEGREGPLEHGEAGADGAGVGFDDGPDCGGDVAPCDV